MALLDQRKRESGTEKRGAAETGMSTRLGNPITAGSPRMEIARSKAGTPKRMGVRAIKSPHQLRLPTIQFVAIAAQPDTSARPVPTMIARITIRPTNAAVVSEANIGNVAMAVMFL